MTLGELATNYNDTINMKEKQDSPADPIVIRPTKEEEKKKKKSGAFGLFKAALSMMRKRPKDLMSYDKSPLASNANWTKLVDSVRPLHLQDNIPLSPPHPVTSEPSPTRQFAVAENMKEMTITPTSPAASSSSTGTMSQYASAASLRDLVDSSDNEEDEEDPDEVFDALCGDELIDAKADEFIAQFYKQLRLQNKGN